MSDQTFMEEACEILATLLAFLAAKDCAAGIHLAQKGCEINDREMEKQGLRMMLKSLGPLAQAMGVPGVDAIGILRMELEGANGEIAS